MIKTEFYSRNIPDDYGGPIPNTNYSTYDLFCLSTRMYPIVHKLLGPEVKISYDTLSLNELTPSIGEDPDTDKHYLYLKLSNGGKRVTDLTKSETALLEQAISKITSEPDKRCLVFGANTLIFDNQGHRISSIWIRSMLGYVDLPFEYDAILDNNGFLVKLPDELDNFMLVYLELAQTIISLVKQMYHEGYVVTTAELAEKWQLELVTGTIELYRPTWSDTRIAPNLNIFLQRAFKGLFQIKVGKNKITRHQIVTKLGTSEAGFRGSFEGDYLRLEVSNLTEVRHILTIVNISVQLAEGRILLLAYRASVWGSVYTRAAAELFPESTIVIYMADHKRIFSCLRPLTEPIIDELSELRATADSIINELVAKHGEAYTALQWIENNW